jgi:hypothetical protein
VNPLTTLCHQALDAIETYYLDQALPLPDRRLVSAGQAPWDCELVNVWVVRDYPTAGGPEGAGFTSIRTHAGHFFRAAVLGVQVARCYPASPDGMTPPPVVDEEDAADLVYGDAEAVWRALLAASLDGTFSQRNGVVYEGWTALGPEGAMAGGVLTLHALLPVPAPPPPPRPTLNAIWSVGAGLPSIQDPLVLGGVRAGGGNTVTSPTWWADAGPANDSFWAALAPGGRVTFALANDPESWVHVVVRGAPYHDTGFGYWVLDWEDGQITTGGAAFTDGDSITVTDEGP